MTIPLRKYPTVARSVGFGQLFGTEVGKGMSILLSDELRDMILKVLVEGPGA
jgi:hypothetical protein